MSAEPIHYITPEEYLAIERDAEYKSEYYDGQVFAMAGGSPDHSLLAANLTVLLQREVRPRGCRTYTADLRVHVAATGLYTYPDGSVVCGQPEWHADDPDSLINPTVLVEVLSPGSENYDRGKKFLHYQSIGALQEYLLVSQEEVRVDRYSRQPDGSWNYASATTLGEAITLPNLGLHLQLAEIYSQTDLAEAGG